VKDFVSLKLSRWIARLTAGFGCTLLIACSSTHIKIENDGYAQLPKSHTILNLPYFPQEEDQCGPASLATMLGARDVTVTSQELSAKVYIPAKEGSLTTEMVARARRHGMVVYPLKPRLSDVFTEISGGNPVLVLQNLGVNWLPRWHFSVVIGYDLQQKTVTLRSGKQIAHEIDLQLFLKTWQRADSWAVVITEPHKLPQTAQETRFLNSAKELELVGEMKAALEAYKAVLERWPANSLAYFGAGNTSYTLERYAQASEFFTGYIERYPKSPAGWNNLAYSLLKLECLDDATTAMSCALHLAPNKSEFLDGYDDISSKKKQSIQSASCEIPKCPL